MKKFVVVIFACIILALVFIPSKSSFINQSNIDNNQLTDDIPIEKIQEIIKKGKSGDETYYDFYEENDMLIFYGNDR